MKKNYLIKDTCLTNVDKDLFNYVDYAKNLKAMIDTNDPPFNIAVIGKWGVGKSSFINLVTSELEKTNGYVVQEINAWKYEKESLSRVFLKQLWQNVSKKKCKTFESIKRLFTDLVNDDQSIPSGKKKKIFAKKIKKWALIIGGASIILFIIYKGIWAQLSGIDFWTLKYAGEVFMSYLKNVGTALIFPLLVVIGTMLIQEINQSNRNKIEINFPIETTDDYESLLGEAICERVKNNKQLKIVTVIDDLDRLSIDKIVEALDALKAFVGFQNCIFIVPFDDSILKKALEVNRTKKLSSDNEVVESELILDKLFQFKIYLPPLMVSDIKEYAYKLAVNNMQDFINEYCEVSLFEKVIKKVLMHSGVKTPRQVIKLLNTFAINLMLAKRRENKKLLKHGISTNEDDIFQIAKFSVLQADYNEFYDILFNDFKYLNKLPELYVEPTAFDDVSDDLKCYFHNRENKAVFKSEEYESLINFLLHTAKYKVANIAPYLYLTQDITSIKLGDANEQRLYAALDSGNEIVVKTMLEDDNDIAEGIRAKLEAAIDDETLCTNLITIINIFDVLSKEYKTVIAPYICDNILDLKHRDSSFKIDLIPCDLLMDIYDNLSDSEYSERMLEQYIEDILNSISDTKDEHETENIPAILKQFLQRLDSFSPSVRKKIKSLVQKVNNLGLGDIIEMGDNVGVGDEPFSEYWGFPWYNRMCHYLEDSNNFDDNVLKLFIDAFNTLHIDADINDLIKPVIPLFGYFGFLQTASSIIDEKTAEKLSVKNSTLVMQQFIAVDNEDGYKILIPLFGHLKYEVTENNNENFDKALSNMAAKWDVSAILKYCCENDYFEMLPITKKLLLDNIVSDEDYTTKFFAIAPYLADNEITLFQDKYSNAFAYNGDEDRYNNLIEIAKHLSESTMNQAYENSLLINIIIPNMQAQDAQLSEPYQSYREMLSNIVTNIMSDLEPESIEQYIAFFTSTINVNTDEKIIYIEKISECLSVNNLKILFDVLPNRTSTTNYNRLFNIFSAHTSSFSNENQLFSSYANFLVDKLEFAEDPNSAVACLNKNFSYISKIDALISKLGSLENVDVEKATTTIAKFMDNSDLFSIASIIVNVLKSNTTELITQSLGKLKKHSIKDLYISINDDFIDNNIELLENLLNIAMQYSDHLESTQIMPCIPLLLQQTDDPEIINRTTKKIVEFGKVFFNKNIDDLVNALYECFHITTSNLAKNEVLLCVSKLNIKSKFNKLLDETEKAYYKSYMK